jgi:pilus assembly protein FimV
MGDALKMSSSTINAGRFALSAVAAAAWMLASSSAWSLGLGRLAVQSALGEPLRAEIDVTSLTSEEAGSLRVRVAPSETYRAAGVDYNPVLPGTQVSLARRADGRAYLRLTSDRVVQEPFVDVILELNWSSGRLVREYTLLFDPPTMARAAPPAPAPVAPSISAAPAPARPAAPPPPAAPPVAVAPPAAAAPPVAARPPAPAAAPRPTPRQVDSYEVQRGDTLTRIANRTLRPGVSLEQMLVALFRTNPQAFMDENMNRLRAGAVLQVPSAADAQGVPTAEARQVIQAQSSDFGSYRRRLAGAAPPVAADEPARTATGQVQTQVNDRQAAAPTPDKLTLTQGAVRGASAPESTVSRDTQQRDSATRVAELSRNVEDLKRLQSGTSTAAPGVAAAPAASPPALPGVTAPVAVAPPAPAASPAAVTPSTAAAPDAAPAPAATPAPAPAPAASPPAKAAAPVAGGEEPGWLDGLLDNPLVLPIAGLLLAALAGLGFYRARSKGRKDSGETSFLESRLQPDSFFGASGGQRIDTRDATGMSSSMSYSLSQLDAIGDVDPVAEADVYLAYGRDLQAEEILKEAMRSNPDRLAIRSKLLEVYAKRRDTKGYELLASQLFALTHGDGEEWAKAQEQGRQIDPDNPLYRPGGRPSGTLAMAAGGGEALGASTMPQSVLPSPSAFAAMDSPATLPNERALDVDLDLSQPADTLPPPAAPERTAPLTSADLDFTLPSVQDDLPAGTPAPAASNPSSGFDFDSLSLDLDPPRVVSAPAPASLPSLDAQPSAPTPYTTVSGALAGEDALVRKLELAEEFRQIGDVDGARDLLEEVIAQAGDGPLRSKAQGLLDSLA